MNTVKIGNYQIGMYTKPFIIAEMSGNHNGSLERAMQLVEIAAKSGAHAIKLQTYTADTMTIDSTKPGFVIEDKNSIWVGRNLYELYKEAYTPWEWHGPIFRKCREAGILAFSTPFDETSVDFLMEFDLPCFKIASFENTDLPLIQKVASTGKPLIVSTGMASLAELDEIVSTARKCGAKELILLKCTSAYPAKAEDIHLSTIPHLSQMFDLPVGLSDHTLGLGVSLAAVSLGAGIVEKHFTLNRNDGGVDSAFSMEPEDLRLLVQESEKVWQAIGRPQYGPTLIEKKSLAFRRSIYVTKDVAKGEKFTKENVRCIRPGFGLPPKEISNVLEKSATKAISRGTPLSWDLIE